jgi:hypothetical protein
MDDDRRIGRLLSTRFENWWIITWYWSFAYWDLWPVICWDFPDSDSIHTQVCGQQAIELVNDVWREEKMVQGFPYWGLGGEPLSAVFESRG